jgi:glycosyltransferase involved in cell wall biosynthesis
MRYPLEAANSAAFPDLIDAVASPRRLRVFMMDLLCIIPYYTGYLCEELVHQDVDVTLGSITYHYDRGHFHRHGIANDPGICDMVAKRDLRSRLVRRSLKVLECWANIAALHARFHRTPPDILHVQYIPLIEENLPLELGLIRHAQRRGSKLVYTVHNELPLDTGGKHRRKYVRLYKLMDALICHSEDAQQRLVQDYGVPPNRLHVIPHGPMFHDLNRIGQAEARRKLKLPAEECIVLWQGWIKPYKGIPFLLSAWQKVHQSGLRARLVIAGSGDPQLEAEIRQQICTLGIADSVRLDLRFIPVDELGYFHEAADIVVYPYREITTSGALMTGLAYGKPVVATRLPVFEKLFEDGQSALLVDYGDASGMAAALQRLICDENQRVRLGEAASRLAGSLPNSWKSIAAATRRCYDTVLGADCLKQTLPVPPTDVRSMGSQHNG